MASIPQTRPRPLIYSQVTCQDRLELPGEILLAGRKMNGRHAVLRDLRRPIGGSIVPKRAWVPALPCEIGEGSRDLIDGAGLCISWLPSPPSNCVGTIE